MEFVLKSLMVGIVLLLGGCDRPPPVALPANSDPEQQSGSDVMSAAAGAAEIELRLVDAAAFATEMESRRGKVVLLDMWATW